jgi:hypothetical protein
MEVSGQLHVPAEGKSPRYLLDRRLAEPQSRSGRDVEEKNSQPCRQSNSDRPARSQSLYRLSYPGSAAHIFTMLKPDIRLLMPLKHKQ